MVIVSNDSKNQAAIAFAFILKRINPKDQLNALKPQNSTEKFKLFL